jgi:molecular chaperone IbpA
MTSRPCSGRASDSIGFSICWNAARLPQADNWPPYDIVKAGEDRYAITMAVAGFLPEELSITTEPNLLIVSGRKQGDRSGEYLHRGIAQRSFERRFELADYVKVVRASLDKGLLTLELQRDIPAEMKPRRIEIQSGTKSQKESGDLRQLEQDSQRAA